MLDICVSLLDYLKIFFFFFFSFSEAYSILLVNVWIRPVVSSGTGLDHQSSWGDLHTKIGMPSFFFRLLELFSVYDPWGCKVVILHFLTSYMPFGQCFSNTVLSWGRFLRYKLQNLSRPLWLKPLGLDHLHANPSFSLAAVSSHMNAVSPPEQDTVKNSPSVAWDCKFAMEQKQHFPKKVSFTSIQKWRKSESVFPFHLAFSLSLQGLVFLL